ncbi:RagB/SusD family nutrient uptake outer membrane protein [Sphingobacterium bambusae]|uniref:RagB/SusD family nutrient uptake outer membrane protein n=1 Tax=Sphingobacterium bambusae TaxID=662858 RepID=A0ABW6BIV6_9SPHI|nr:RagB/SusD family nutrient uptake outer membrane protein [Sphingobacterium bambusae]WPL49460.1 RagB/SusD family nutrient uptake outer membrane protein [Sphingobacterium bambusae]
MKKNIKLYIMLPLLTFLSFSSCQKWMDVRPITEDQFDRVFSTETGFSQAMIGVYGSMNATQLYGRELTFGVLDVMAGYYTPQDGGTQAYGKIRTNYPYKRNNANKDETVVNIINNFWTGLYSQIANLNNVLMNIDSRQSVFTGDNYRLIKGEALGLRAFLHFDLLRMYGPSFLSDQQALSIPYVDTLSSIVTQRLTVTQATDRIIEDLQKSLALMDQDPIRTGENPNNILAPASPSSTLSSYHNRRYRFNYYAVAATLARVYLWKNDKINAAKYARIAIDAQSAKFPWVANPQNIIVEGNTARDRTFTTEHIFALNNPLLEDYAPLYFTAGGSSAATRLVVSQQNRTTIYEDNTEDIRNQYFFTAYVNSENSRTYFFPTKYLQNAGNSIWYKQQIPLIRISEMYYIAAECTEDLAEASEYLNTVRSARKITSILSLTNVNKDNEILKEYQKEFLGDGQLWYYCKRKDLSKPQLNELFDWGVWNKEWYVFDMPENEFQYGGR